VCDDLRAEDDGADAEPSSREGRLDVSEQGMSEKCTPATLVSWLVVRQREREAATRVGPCRQ
jgi:hypothetical protein